MTAVIVSCEHGGNRVPRRYRPLFAGKDRLLASHRGHDPGSLALARIVARRLGAPLRACTVSRLVVEVNRSIGHPRLFSEVTRGLPPEERERLLETVYRPHRERVEETVRTGMQRGRRVVHLSVHTFAPVLRGERRDAEVGLLYDPARHREKRLCIAAARVLRERTDLVVRRNYPYRGRADGLTTFLRRRLPASRYLGIEIEVNQRFARGGASRLAPIGAALAEAIEAGLGARRLRSR